MEIFGAIAGLFLAVSNPHWFDKGPYEYVNTYTTIEQCQTAAAKGDICTTEIPIQQYRKVRQTKDYNGYGENTADLVWMECDHALGCYNKPGVHTKRNNGLKYGRTSLVFNPQDDPDSFK